MRPVSEQFQHQTALNDIKEKMRQSNKKEDRI